MIIKKFKDVKEKLDPSIEEIGYKCLNQIKVLNSTYSTTELYVQYKEDTIEALNVCSYIPVLTYQGVDLRIWTKDKKFKFSLFHTNVEDTSYLAYIDYPEDIKAPELITLPIQSKLNDWVIYLQKKEEYDVKYATIMKKRETEFLASLEPLKDEIEWIHPHHGIVYKNNLKYEFWCHPCNIKTELSLQESMLISPTDFIRMCDGKWDEKKQV